MRRNKSDSEPASSSKPRSGLPSLEQTLSPPHASLIRHSKRKPVELDPENHLIKKLRTENSLTWGAIAQRLNADRIDRGEEPTMTVAAVYSRFVRNAPRIASAQGQVGFDPRDYMYLRHPHSYHGLRLGTNMLGRMKQGAMRKMAEQEKNRFERRRAADDEIDEEELEDDEDGDDDDVCETVEVPKEIRNNVRRRCVEAADLADLDTNEGQKKLEAAVRVIEKNFWVFVADELERTTGKLYETKMLERKFDEQLRDS